MNSSLSGAMLGQHVARVRRLFRLECFCVWCTTLLESKAPWHTAVVRAAPLAQSLPARHYENAQRHAQRPRVNHKEGNSKCKSFARFRIRIGLWRVRSSAPKRVTGDTPAGLATAVSSMAMKAKSSHDAAKADTKRWIMVRLCCAMYTMLLTQAHASHRVLRKVPNEREVRPLA